MLRVSSGATLFFKLFLPTFWLVFFGSLTLFILFSDNVDMPFIGSIGFKASSGIFFLLGLLFFYFTCFQLKRIDVDEKNFYVSNYFTTFKYEYKDISKIKERDWLFFKTIKLHFIEKSSFGKRITFLKRRKIFDEFVEANPEVFSHLL